MSICVERIGLRLYRAQVSEPVRTSFGSIPARTLMLIRVEDSDGAAGWGEIWCSIPAYSAENKIRLMETLVAPAVLGQRFTHPAEAWHLLSNRLHRIAMQCGEPGPIGACLAGLDIAMWDLHARRAGRPLRDMLAGQLVRAAVPAYASGLNPDTAVATMERARAAGFRAFKVKLGFGFEADLALLDRAEAALDDGETLMADVNQGWDMTEARRILPFLSRHCLGWVEEPVLANSTAAEWAELAVLAGAPLAGGENVSGFRPFAELVFNRHHAVVQPDALKWGGITANWLIARRIVAAGLSYCPHWLGSGVGLLVSAQLLAAAGGPGLLEHDVMENPLRDASTPLPPVVDGVFALDSQPGWGAEPVTGNAARWLVEERTFHR